MVIAMRWFCVELGNSLKELWFQLAPLAVIEPSEEQHNLANILLEKRYPAPPCLKTPRPQIPAFLLVCVPLFPHKVLSLLEKIFHIEQQRRQLKCVIPVVK